jgi:hypothetical protein
VLPLQRQALIQIVQIAFVYKWPNIVAFIHVIANSQFRKSCFQSFRKIGINIFLHKDFVCGITMLLISEFDKSMSETIIFDDKNVLVRLNRNSHRSHFQQPNPNQLIHKRR